MNRRTFLQVAAAAPCVFGLRDLLAQDPDVRPAWFKLALARMKERKLYGVVVLAPSADPAQKKFGEAIWELLEEKNPAAHELFLTSVFIFLTPAAAESCGVLKAGEEVDRLLLDPDGGRVAGDRFDPKAVLAEKDFVASFTPFVHGEEGARLKARAIELSASAPAAVLTAIQDLAHEELARREAASGALKEKAADFVPLYAWTRRTSSDPEVTSRLVSIIEGHFGTLPATVPGARLPYGTRIPEFADRGCGSLQEMVENEPKSDGPMVACGMGRIDGTKNKAFLRFLTK